jgi:pilus assembly protein CpaB
LLAFMMATILAGSISYLLFRRLRSSASQRHVVQIIAAAKDLSSGITLTAKDVTPVDWPSDLPLAGAFSKVEDVVGRPLIFSRGANEPLLKRDLGVEGSGIGLAGRIPTGMRATAVRSNEIVGVAGFLYPGSHVDVLVTYTPPGSGSGPVTQTVLQNVEVLTAGQTIEPDPQGKPATVNVVTLLVNPEDSQKLQLASSQGTVQFVLRSGVDQKSPELRPTRLDQLSTAAKPATTTKAGPKRALPPPQRTIYVLEVIQGTKRSTEKFE